MSFQNLFLTFLFIPLILQFGCFSGELSKDNNSKDLPKASNSGKTKPELNKPLSTKKTPLLEKFNSAEKIAPVVKAYCDAMRKKDDAALAKVYSKTSLSQLQNDMSEEGTKSLSEYLSSEPVGDKCEVRNEKIDGNTAIALVITETYPNGIQIKFMKEKNSWKMTNQSAELDVVKSTEKASKK